MAVFASSDFELGSGALLTTNYPDFVKHPTSSIDALTSGGNVGTNEAITLVYYHIADPASADYSVFGDVVMSVGLSNSTRFAAVLGRVSTTLNTFYMARFISSHVSHSWQMYRFLNGAVLQLGATVATSNPNDRSTREIELRMTGDQISMYANGALVIGPIIDSEITAAGKAGLRSTGTFEQGPVLADWRAEDESSTRRRSPLLLTPW